LLRVPEILRDDIAHAGDLGELVPHLLNGQVEMLRSDQENVVRFAFPNRAQQTGHQLDQTARLLELLILLEERDDVFQARMERVGGGDFIGDCLGAAIGDLGLGCFLQLFAVGVRDVVDLGSIGQGFEKALTEDVVDFVVGEVNWGDRALGTPEFLPSIVEGAIDERAARLIGREEV
jgi:hypothetical protein